MSIRCRWRHSYPTEPGMYLRSNPPCSAIVKQSIVEVDGVLLTPHGDGPLNLTPLTELSERFWWYGPIPQPPWKPEDQCPQLVYDTVIAGKKK